MKKPVTFFRDIEGTIMIFSLVVILGGTIVLAGWAQMMATRAIYTTMTEEGQKRRIAIANGRALARQYVLNQMPSGAIGSALQGTNFSLSNGWGGFAINYAAALWTNTNYLAGNPFNPICGSSFVVTNLGTISNSVETCNWTFLIRGRSPVLAGFPAVFHNPLLTSSTNQFTNVSTYKIYWSNIVGLPKSPVIPFTSGSDAAGPGTNSYIGYFASPLNTNYAFTDVANVSGALSITNYNTNGATYVSTNAGSNTNTFITNYTGGSVSLVLNSSDTNINTVLRYTIANSVTNIYSTTNTNGSKVTIRRYSNGLVTNLTLVASTASNTLHLIADTNNTNLSSITLSGTNNSRRLCVFRDGSQNLTLKTESTGSNYSWWMALTAVNTNASLTINAPTNAKSLTLTGGVRTDRTITVTGQLTILSNSLPASNAEVIMDRFLWLEDQRTP